MKTCYLLTFYNTKRGYEKKLGVVPKKSLEGTFEGSPKPIDKLAELLNGFNDYESGGIFIHRDRLKRIDGKKVLKLPGKLNDVKLPEEHGGIIIHAEKLDLFSVKDLKEV